MSYYEKNKDVRLHYQKQYYQENKEQIKKYTKKYYETNKEKLKQKRKGKLPVKKKEKDCQFYRIDTEVTLSFR
jgi:hypothetical protein